MIFYTVEIDIRRSLSVLEFNGHRCPLNLSVDRNVLLIHILN